MRFADGSSGRGGGASSEVFARSEGEGGVDAEALATGGQGGDGFAGPGGRGGAGGNVSLGDALEGDSSGPVSLRQEAVGGDRGDARGVGLPQRGGAGGSATSRLTDERRNRGDLLLRSVARGGQGGVGAGGGASGPGGDALAAAVGRAEGRVEVEALAQAGSAGTPGTAATAAARAATIRPRATERSWSWSTPSAERWPGLSSSYRAPPPETVAKPHLARRGGARGQGRGEIAAVPRSSPRRGRGGGGSGPVRGDGPDGRDANFAGSAASSVPEPGAALLLLGLAAVALARKRLARAS